MGNEVRICKENDRTLAFSKSIIEEANNDFCFCSSNNKARNFASSFHSTDKWRCKAILFRIGWECARVSKLVNLTCTSNTGESVPRTTLLNIYYHFVVLNRKPFLWAVGILHPWMLNLVAEIISRHRMIAMSRCLCSPRGQGRDQALSRPNRTWALPSRGQQRERQE